MRRSAIRVVVAVAVLILLLGFVALPLTAAPGPAYTIANHTIDGGGGQSSGGQFTLTGTIGQFDANPQSASGASFVVTGGFWARFASALDTLFKDGFEGP